jgi:hypothetical protein
MDLRRNSKTALVKITFYTRFLLKHTYTFLFDTMSLNIRMFGCPGGASGGAVFTGLNILRYSNLMSVLRCFLQSPPDKYLKLGHNFLPPTFEFTVCYNQHIQRHTVKTTDVIT